jgi:hypothetical protein
LNKNVEAMDEGESDISVDGIIQRDVENEFNEREDTHQL